MSKTETKKSYLRIRIGPFREYQQLLKMKKKKWQQKDFAKTARVSKEHLSRVMCWNERPSRKLARRIVDHINKHLNLKDESAVTLEDLFEVVEID